MLKKIFFIIYFYFKKEKVKNIRKILKYFYDKSILEIGGPSRFFHKNIPIYQLAGDISGINFSEETVWEGKIEENHNYNYFKNKMGWQYIAEAVSFQLDKKFDMIISSNCIEHIANPLLAIQNWINHLDKNGTLLLVAPKKESNFDHQRQDTTFEHLIDDYEHNTLESDMTHLEEVLMMHDFSKDDGILKASEIKNMLYKNFDYRLMHHHVFSIALLEKIAKFFSCKIISKGNTKKNYYILMAKI